MSKYDDLVRKLKEIFQIDRPELDFGIYRILNARVSEINDYLENRLKVKVAESLASAGANNLEGLHRELKEKEAQYRSDGIDPDTVPKIKELRQKLADLGSGSAEHENTVFTHLLIFFSRYYDKGDFISQRRYKGDTYAIPYAGEEVVLHWANKDQYYTKSGENFSNYGFKLDDGRSIRFRLVAADTAKDNRKDNDKERCFVLVNNQVVTRIDDDGVEYEEELLPVEEMDGANGKELILRFEYKPMPKGTKQDTLLGKAVETVLAEAAIKARWLDLGKRSPTEKSPQRTLLEKHLIDYTAKNTADYFIHKDLSGFLHRELDFYIKNEVMHLDDVQDVGTFAGIEKSLRMIQCLRAIALELIDFLAQLENFQKKLWLKKKFVVSANYCITLDRMPEALYSEIMANERQWQQWHKLGVRENAAPGTLDELKTQPYWMVDTAFFTEAFKTKLLHHISDLDDQIEGLVISADNFQGLRLINERYKKQIDLIHIDPPYNTFSSGFLYKNSFRHSSWLSLMQSRLQESLPLLAENYCYQVHIDENEYERLYNLFEDNNFPYLSSVIWNKKNPMMGGKGIASQHEYIIWASSSDDPFPMKNENVLEIIKYKDSLITKHEGVTYQCRQEFTRWVKSNKTLTGGERAYHLLEDDGRIYRLVAMTWPNPNQAPEQFFIPLVHPVNGEKCPVPSRGWSRSPTKMRELIEKNEIVFGKDHCTIPQRKIYLTVESRKPLPSELSNGDRGKAEIDNMGLEFSYCHPTSLYQEILYAGTRNSRSSTVLDYFAGSGTTGHATLFLNKFDQGERKYILIEQGLHIDSVLLPRLQKAVFSLDWKEGKPSNPHSGSSHCIKVIRLESYEDTLNNLHLTRAQEQQTLFEALPNSAKEDYLLRYMLDIESRGSLLSVEQFRKPFDCKLKVAMDSAGAFEERTIDLVETFNYLIGLRVKHIDMQLGLGFVSVTGFLPSGEKALVLWRDIEKLDYDSLNRLCEKLAINPADSEFDVVFINGDHNIPAVFTSTEAEGGITKTLKIRQIEPEFMSRMFDTGG